jgi:hypothetical protein
MANAFYPKWKDAIQQSEANSDLDQTGVNGVYAALIDTATYTYNAAHEFYSSLSGIVGTDQEITGATVVDDTFDGNDVSFPAVSGATVEAIVIYRKNAGANTTWRLVAYLDTGYGGLPVTPNGQAINIAWHATGILKL